MGSIPQARLQSRSRRIFRLCALALSGYLLFVTGRYLFTNVPMFEFVPVCERPWKKASERLRELDGATTVEFQRMLRQRYMGFLEPDPYRAPLADRENFAIINERVRVTWAYQTSFFDPPLHGLHRPLENQFLDSSFIVYHMLEKRKTSGEIADEVLTKFVAVSKTGERQQLGYADCGLMKELILVGGRFAGE